MASAESEPLPHGSPGEAPEEVSGASAWVLRPPSVPVVQPNGAPHVTGAGPARRCRIALYSPGLVGLGHMRRNQLIAQTLARSPLQPAILMIAEAREACTLAMPPRADCLTLPGFRKERDGECKARYLDISLQDLIALRAKLISTALEAFEPDVLIVDNLPRGALRELDPTLAYLRASRRTRCVLGLRDVLDDPAVVEREWSRTRNEEAINEYYDAVWVYGDPAVFDLVRTCRFSRTVAAKARYTGYLNQCMRLCDTEPADAELLQELPLPSGRFVLCLVGGGQDGDQVAEAFAHADLPADTHGVIVTGPFMPPDVQQRLRARAARHPRLQLLGFVNEPTRLMRHADRVIAMGGYNTLCEVLSFEKRALIVPRVKPRLEQWIRAERLRELGLIDVLHPNDLSPMALTAWLTREMGPPPRARDRIDFDGLAHLPVLLAEVLALSCCAVSA